MLKERPFPFPTDKSIRVIFDTDCYNECDDQYAVAHLLMTPRFDVRAITAAHYGQHKDKDSEQKSYEEIEKIASLMGLREEVTILHGAPHALPDAHTPIDSEAARFIIEEAYREDSRPLFVCSLGAVTNLASALLLDPVIAGRFTAIWIGGIYPEGGVEFNQANDLNAARVLLGSTVELWQVPRQAYSKMKISYYELLNHVYPCGELGKYLLANTMRVAERTQRMLEGRTYLRTGSNDAEEIRRQGGDSWHTAALSHLTPAEAMTQIGGECWSLGDSPCIGLMMNNSLGEWIYAEAPCAIRDDGTYDYSKPGSRKIRMYTSVDVRFILQDMLEKLEYNFRE